MRIIPIALVIAAIVGLAFFYWRGKTAAYYQDSFTEPADAVIVSSTIETQSTSSRINNEKKQFLDAVDEDMDQNREEVVNETPDIIQAREILSGMTLDEKIYQMFIVTPEQLMSASAVTHAGEETKAALDNYPVGGIVYFSYNIVSREQCAAMISNTQSYSKLGLFIAVDEEGGTVARIGNNNAMGTTSFPAMGAIGETRDFSQAYNVGYTIGTEIGELGFNLDFAPVADVNSNPSNPVIGTRAFHSDPKITAEMVAACVQGFNDSGLLCTLKHFPGHGDTDTDSHYGEAQTEKTLGELFECEILPFKAGIQAGAPFIMVGHITAPNVTETPVPASLSYEIVTEVLRNTLGFEGLVITDSMSMQAITSQYSPDEAAVKALQAGVDIFLMPESLSDAFNGIKEAVAVGEVSEARIDESVLRILEVKIQSGIIAVE